jgi:hypothetical protein
VDLGGRAVEVTSVGEARIEELRAEPAQDADEGDEQGAGRPARADPKGEADPAY